MKNMPWYYLPARKIKKSLLFINKFLWVDYQRYCNVYVAENFIYKFSVTACYQW